MMIRMLLNLLLVFILIMSFILGVGIGVGYALRWALPVLDLGISILIGVIVLAVSLNFLSRLMAMLSKSAGDDEGEGADKEVVYLIGPEAIRRRRRRK